YLVWENSKSHDNLFTHTVESEHAAHRRIVANAYTLTALLELERFVDSCIDQLSTQLSTLAGTTVDMSFWLQAYAFDVVGELAFGNAFGYLASGQDVGGQIQN